MLDNPSPTRSWELPKLDEKKIGGGLAVPDHLVRTDYAEMCIFVTKYISKLNKIQKTNYMPRI